MTQCLLYIRQLFDCTFYKKVRPQFARQQKNVLKIILLHLVKFYRLLFNIRTYFYVLMLIKTLKT